MNLISVNPRAWVGLNVGLANGQGVMPGVISSNTLIEGVLHYSIRMKDQSSGILTAEQTYRALQFLHGWEKKVAGERSRDRYIMFHASVRTLRADFRLAVYGDEIRKLFSDQPQRCASIRRPGWRIAARPIVAELASMLDLNKVSRGDAKNMKPITQRVVTLVDGQYQEEEMIVEERPDSWKRKGSGGDGLMSRLGGGKGVSHMRRSRGERPPRRKLCLVNMDKRLTAALRNTAAMHLQRLFRGMQGRVWAAAFVPWHAARDIQRVGRGYLGKKRYEAFFVSFHQGEAATAIQAKARGKMARLYLHGVIGKWFQGSTGYSVISERWNAVWREMYFTRTVESRLVEDPDSLMTLLDTACWVQTLATPLDIPRARQLLRRAFGMAPNNPAVLFCMAFLLLSLPPKRSLEVDPHHDLKHELRMKGYLEKKAKEEEERKLREDAGAVAAAAELQKAMGHSGDTPPSSPPNEHQKKRDIAALAKARMGLKAGESLGAGPPQKKKKGEGGNVFKRRGGKAGVGVKGEIARRGIVVKKMGGSRQEATVLLKRAFLLDPLGRHATHYERKFYQRSVQMRPRCPDVLVRYAMVREELHFDTSGALALLSQAHTIAEERCELATAELAEAVEARRADEALRAVAKQFEVDVDVIEELAMGARLRHTYIGGLSNRIQRLYRGFRVRASVAPAKKALRTRIRFKRQQRHPDVALAMALVLHAIELQYEAAVPAYERVIELDPKGPAAYYGLGLLLIAISAGRAGKEGTMMEADSDYLRGRRMIERGRRYDGYTDADDESDDEEAALNAKRVANLNRYNTKLSPKDRVRAAGRAAAEAAALEDTDYKLLGSSEYDAEEIVGRNVRLHLVGRVFEEAKAGKTGGAGKGGESKAAGGGGLTDDTGTEDNGDEDDVSSSDEEGTGQDEEDNKGRWVQGKVMKYSTNKDMHKIVMKNGKSEWHKLNPHQPHLTNVREIFIKIKEGVTMGWSTHRNIVGDDLIGRQCEILWSAEDGPGWYAGRVAQYSRASKQHRVRYEDGTTAWYDFSETSGLQYRVMPLHRDGRHGSGGGGSTLRNAPAKAGRRFSSMGLIGESLVGKHVEVAFTEGAGTAEEVEVYHPGIVRKFDREKGMHEVHFADGTVQAFDFRPASLHQLQYHIAPDRRRFSTHKMEGTALIGKEIDVYWEGGVSMSGDGSAWHRAKVQQYSKVTGQHMVKYAADGQLAWYDFRDRSDHLLIYRTVTAETEAEEKKMKAAVKEARALASSADRAKADEEERRALGDAAKWTAKGKAFLWVEHAFFTPVTRAAWRYRKGIFGPRASKGAVTCARPQDEGKPLCNMALVLQYVRRQPDEAKTVFLRALEEAPEDMTTQLCYQDFFDEGLVEVQSIKQRDHLISLQERRDLRQKQRVRDETILKREEAMRRARHATVAQAGEVSAAALKAERGREAEEGKLMGEQDLLKGMRDNEKALARAAIVGSVAKSAKQIGEERKAAREAVKGRKKAAAEEKREEAKKAKKAMKARRKSTAGLKQAEEGTEGGESKD